MNMEKDSGLIVTDGLGINIEVNRTGKFNVFVKKVTDDSCEAKINTLYQQTIKFGDVISQRKCISTGGLEAEFYKLVNDKLK
jgi:PIN domain nuclease of toxin-antitoxin system